MVETKESRTISDDLEPLFYGGDGVMVISHIQYRQWVFIQLPCQTRTSWWLSLKQGRGSLEPI